MGCRPIGFLLGLPFMVVGFFLSLIGVVVWIVGSVLGCFCPCCSCFALLIDFALQLIKLPITIMEWFTTKFPC